MPQRAAGAGLESQPAASVPEWPELEPAEATAARLQSGAAEARRQARRQERAAATREEVRRWRAARGRRGGPLGDVLGSCWARLRPLRT